MTETTALLPCPFCGGDAEIERIGDARRSTIYRCTYCGCSLETGEEWGHGRRWNERSTPPALPAAPVAEGWRLVPVEPTDAMMNAGEAAYRNECIAYEGAVPDDVVCHSVLRAMLAAAPPAPGAAPASDRQAEALTVQAMRNRLREIDGHLAEGFVGCPRCGEEVATSDMDVRSDLAELIGATPPAGEGREALTLIRNLAAEMGHADTLGFEEARERIIEAVDAALAAARTKEG